MHHILLSLTRSLRLGILFSTVVRAAVVAKFVTTGISPLSSFILALRVVLVAKLVISGILSLVFFYLSIIYIFLTTYVLLTFFTASLGLPKSTEIGTNLSTSNLLTLLFKLLKSVGTSFNLSISNLSTLDFKLAKSTFLAKYDVLPPAAFFK